jgi:hypothetical protein
MVKQTHIIGLAVANANNLICSSGVAFDSKFMILHNEHNVSFILA